MSEKKFKVALTKLAGYFKLERVFEPEDIEEISLETRDEDEE